MNLETLTSLRDQLRQLEARRAGGMIDEHDFLIADQGLRAAIVDAVMAPVPRAPRPSARLLAGCGAVVLALAAAGYAWTGHPQAWNPQAVAPVDDPAIVAMVERLAQRLRTQPEDVDGWVMLGRSMTVLERHEAAAQAFGEALARRPGDPVLRELQAQALSRAAPPAPAPPAAPR